MRREQLRGEFEQLRGEIEGLGAEQSGGGDPPSGGGFRDRARASLAVLALTAAVAAAAGTFALNGGQDVEGRKCFGPPVVERAGTRRDHGRPGERGALPVFAHRARPADRLPRFECRPSRRRPPVSPGHRRSSSSAIRSPRAARLTGWGRHERRPGRPLALDDPEPEPARQGRSLTHLRSRSRRHRLRPPGPAAARATARYPGDGGQPGDGGHTAAPTLVEGDAGGGGGGPGKGIGHIKAKGKGHDGGSPGKGHEKDQGAARSWWKAVPARAGARTTIQAATGTARERARGEAVDLPPHAAGRTGSAAV